MVQETHLNPAEHGVAARQHAAMWGFKHTVVGHLSFWASGNSRNARVGILVNPYGEVSNLMETEWNEHWIAGKKVLFIIVYAPTHGQLESKQIRKLATMELPEEVDVLCGGDLNCLLDGEIDRSGGSRGRDMGAR
jgi:hypothetical protein